MKTHLGNERLVFSDYFLEFLEEALVLGNNQEALIYYLNHFITIPLPSYSWR
jgi:hypothetical protein